MTASSLIYVMYRSEPRYLSENSHICTAAVKIPDKQRGLGLSRSLAVATHNLHLVCMYGRLVVQLEVDIFDEKGPHFIAEPVGI